MVTGRISVLTVDDHALVRQGLARMLEGAEGFELVGEAAAGAEAVELYRHLRPDLTLLDIQMPDMSGLEALAKIRREFSDARVIILTVYRGAAPARRALRAGAVGYVPKGSSNGVLREAMRVVHSGGQYIGAEFAAELAQGMDRDELSDAEIEVLRLVAAGHSNKRVAHALRIPEETVKSRMKSISRKLSALDRTHCVTLALMQGIIEMD